MAPEWEIPMGMDFGMGMGVGVPYSTTSMSSSPAYNYGFPPAGTGDVVDDLLDFPNQDIFPSTAAASTAAAVAVTDNQFLAPAEHCVLVSGDQAMSASSAFQSQPGSFDFYIPCEEAAELEWLSKFVDDSYSDVSNYQSSCKILTAANETSKLRTDQPAASGRGARSKRSRAASAVAAAAAWTSALVPHPPSHSSPSSSSSSSSSDHFPPPQTNSAAGDHYNHKVDGGDVNALDGSLGKKGGEGRSGDIRIDGCMRRCTHCASEKTPQWRTGPLGPKTLCNACGVRYKSGRLVPEYRPAASPTFVHTHHSNSHRKVMELRRQRELIINNNHNNAAAPGGAASRPDLLFNDHQYGVC